MATVQGAGRLWSSSILRVVGRPRLSWSNGLSSAFPAAVSTTRQWFSTRPEEKIMVRPSNLIFDPAVTCSPFYGLAKISKEPQAAPGVEGDPDDCDDDVEMFDASTRPEPLKAIPLPERLHVDIHQFNCADEDGNTKVGTIHLSRDVFGCDPIRTDILQRVVQYQRNKKRGKRYPAYTKTISEVSGSGKKMRAQKGSGNARCGHKRPPHWRGGAKAHGPKGVKQDYTTKLNKKVRKMGLRMALSQKLKEQNLILVDSFNIPNFKTSTLDSILYKNFGIAGKFGATAVLVDDAYHDQESNDQLVLQGVNANVKVASQNLFKIKVMNELMANVYDLLKYEKLVLSLAALQTLEKRLSSK